MKEDVLEQIVDDYLQLQGYFTRHNVRFGPPPVQGTPSQSHSDLDVIGFHPRARSGERRVVVVSCKSWRKGFNATEELTALRKDGMSHGGKARWGFRDLGFPDWSNALHQMVLDLTGESRFTYRIAVTRLRGISTALDWEKEPTINANLRGCSFGFLTLQEMLRRATSTGIGHDASGRSAPSRRQVTPSAQNGIGRSRSSSGVGP